MSDKDLDHYRQDFARVEARFSGDRNGSAWLHKIRQSALDVFSESGFPTTRHEEWRFTDVSSIAKKHFQLAAGRSSSSGNGVDATPFLFAEGKAYQLVFVDGEYSSKFSEVKDLPHGVEISNLASAIANNPKRIEPYLARYADPKTNAFTAWNTAFMREGAYLHISSGTILDRPIHIVYLFTHADEPTVVHPRNLIVTGSNSQAAIVESYVSLSDSVYLTNAVTEIALGEYSVLDHYKVQREGSKAFHFATVEAHQSLSSTFQSFSLNLGGKLSRSNINAVMDAEGCNVSMNGFYFGKGKQHIDNQTSIDHVKPRGTSREYYKGILDGKSRAIFNGKIVVRPDASKSDARQTNKNLILSNDTRIDSKPQLEIFNNDVLCAHGATVGQLDEDSIFYLRSRGIDHETAKKLLTYAFASEILNRIRVEPLKKQVLELLSADFPIQDRELELA